MSHDIESADLSKLRQQYESETQVARSYGQKISSGQNAHNYIVKSVPLYTADGKPANAWGNQRTDTGVIIGVTSERYGIVQNSAFTDSIENGFRDIGLSYTKRDAIVTRWGARSHIEYEFNTRTAIVAKGDTVALRIIARNSFDGTSKSSISVGAVRLVCLNGMTSFKQDLSMSVRHTTNVSPAFVNQVLQQAMSEWAELNNVWANMARINVTQQQGYTIIENLTKRGIYAERFAKAVTDVWARPSYREDEGRNIWNLYNAHTQVLTHNYGIAKYEMTQRSGHNIVTSLRGASVNENEFLSLVTPAGKDN
jgi:hypothetical protein